MNITVIVGGQYGDEGKGKFVHYLVHKEQFNIVGRGNGGPNAGHNVYDPARNVEIALHLMPSGIFSKQAVNIVGCGTVVNPLLFLEEIATVKAHGAVVTPDTLLISDRAHIILDVHRLLDVTKDKVGSTGQGIGPAYRDKATRLGLRMGAMLEENFIDQAATRIHDIASELQVAGTNIDKHAIAMQVQSLDKAAKTLKPYITDTVEYIHQSLLKNKSILIEGAQATMLDINYGTYPFVTSSSTTGSGIATGLGIPGHYVNRTIGIFKLPMTRVGKGPFVTRLTETENDIHTHLAGIKGSAGSEFGATTGRARDIGWMDLVMLRYSHTVNGFTDIALTKLDMLSGIPTLKIATEYKYNGTTITTMPSSVEILNQCTPIYTELPGWKESIAGVTTYNQLPINAQKYVEFIEKSVGIPVTMIGTGPNNDDLVCR